MEWSRIFVLSGFSWNPIGLTLASSDYARQLASIGGVFGLSFWVMFTNTLALRAAFSRTFPYMWIAAVLFPYIFGAIHIAAHTQLSFSPEKEKPFSALLVQTAFPAEESAAPLKPENLIAYVVDEWKQIIETIQKHKGKKLDIIVLPEFVVPFGTYPFAYPLTMVYKIFEETCGPECLASLPHLISPYAAVTETRHGPQMMVNNAYWAQAIANIFKTSVLAGLEDAEDDTQMRRHYYSAALLFHEQTKPIEVELDPLARYEKRVLVPLGEYIPFEFCRKIAANYGVLSSFTSGSEAKVMHAQGGVPFSPLICYEETFSYVVREGRLKGANLLVNLTSDAWYPNSELPRQHFEHARLRTVENGVPLIRACNNGITGAIDCFGRDISVLGGDNPESVEWIQDALFVEFPLKHYWTMYSRFGDAFIVILSAIIVLLGGISLWRAS